MYFLYFLGTLLEPAIGKLRFGAIYFVSLLGGSFGALLLSPNSVTVGASGAVFGTMGAAILALSARGIDPWQSGLGVTLLLNLAITFLIPGIAIGGHLGGLAAGFAVGYLMFDAGRAPAPVEHDRLRRVDRARRRAGDRRGHRRPVRGATGF